MFSSRTATEGTSTLRSHHVFARATGTLTRTRTLAGATPAPNDLVTELTRDSRGNIEYERYYGGDTQPIATGALATSTLTAAAPAYSLAHQWLAGTVVRSTYLAANGTPLAFTIQDADADLATGRLLRTRDAAGLATTFTYDTTGRLTTIAAPGMAPATYAYTTASMDLGGYLPAKAVARQVSAENAGTIATDYVYDAFGRLLRESGGCRTKPIRRPAIRWRCGAYASRSTTRSAGRPRTASGPASRATASRLPARESADPRLPQSWNRYSYVMNNPLKYVDPTGENATVVCDVDNNCTATVEAQIIADPNDPQQMETAIAFRNGAVNYWQGTQVTGPDGENVTIQMNVTIVAPGEAVAAVDTLNVVNGSGVSNVQMTLLRGALSPPDGGTIFTQDSTGNPSGMAGISAHEGGHLLGMPDMYVPGQAVPLNTSPTVDVMRHAQPTNSPLLGGWILRPQNGNTIVIRVPRI
jgi:YD repeat-containing protein